MAGSLNEATLIGRLGKDPEVRNTQSGNKIVSLSVATSDRWRDRTSGENKERTEWHRVVVFAEHAANFADQYLRKGSLVLVKGPIRTRKWQDQQGQDRYSTEICVENFRGSLTDLSERNGGDASDRQSGAANRSNDRGRSDDPRYNATHSAGQAPATGPSWGPPGGRDLDDEIPF